MSGQMAEGELSVNCSVMSVVQVIEHTFGELDVDEWISYIDAWCGTVLFGS